MNSNLQIFNYNGLQVRTIQQNGEAWFIAKDICDVLGISKYRDAISKLDDDERGSLKVDTLGGIQNMTAINESGMYALVFRSNKPEAKQFSRWVRHDVLPDIRKHGMYISDSVLGIYYANPDAFKFILDDYSRIKKENETNKPLVILGTVVLPQKGSLTFQETAHMLAQHGIPIGQNRLYKWCRDKGLLCRRKGKQWNRPSQKAIEQGLFGVQLSGGFYSIPVVTPLGLKFISYQLVKENYPLIALIEEA